MKHRSIFGVAASLALALVCVFAAVPAQAKTVTADVVALDQSYFHNRLGAANPGGMIYALAEDVVTKSVTCGSDNVADNTPLLNELNKRCTPLQLAGNVQLRPDKRARPLILRMNVGDDLKVTFYNLLDPLRADADQMADRTVGFHPNGLQLAGSIDSDSSFVGKNVNNSMAAPGETKVYTFHARTPKAGDSGNEGEGAYFVDSLGATFGSEGSGGNIVVGLFGVVHVEPVGSTYVRNNVTDEDLRLANRGFTADGHPVVDYNAVYPNLQPWIAEGKAGRPVLKMICDTLTRQAAFAIGAPQCTLNRLLHSDLNAVIAYDKDGANNLNFANPNNNIGKFPASTYPIERVTNGAEHSPQYPNRLEPFREHTVVFHDEVAGVQAFPGFYNDIQFKRILAGVKDGFMINYGSGGIGSEIIANRLGVGPMHDCLNCAYEEFFLTSFTVSDPASLTDVPANAGLEALAPGQPPPAVMTGPKASKILFPDDPGNIHHTYQSDFVKFRNTHAGPKEHHIFHMHNNQWLFNANDENSNYLDAQGIGPGGSYTYEVLFGGAGNRNKSLGDAIFHCHFYPHFAQGMWEHFRIHDVFEAGTLLKASVAGGVTVTGKPGTFHIVPFELFDGTPNPGARALPDAEVVAGYPIVALVPLPGKPMAPMPGPATVKANPLTTTASTFHPDPGTDLDTLAPGIQVPVGSLADVARPLTTNPGFPFFIAGIEDTVGQRPPTPVLDMLPDEGGWDGGLPRHTLAGYAAGGEDLVNEVNRFSFDKATKKAKAFFYPETGTDVENVAMAFHEERCHDTYYPDGSPAACNATPVTNQGKKATGGYITNGAPRAPSAPFAEPCVDDQGNLMTAGETFHFFDKTGSAFPGKSVGPLASGHNDARHESVYAGAVIQYDAVFNKDGWHFPQQRILALWKDAVPVMNGIRPPEPLVMRTNTMDCVKYLHANLVPRAYIVDDFQVTTPTDIVGQHIHLPKFEVISGDGAANGWNYEDGTLSPGTVRERIDAINAFGIANSADGTGSPATVKPTANLVAKDHPYFNATNFPGHPQLAAWKGARTTMQRWFADPVINRAGVDRGWGISFTHDHYGPSTHQQTGMYSTILSEPYQSEWRHNETGKLLGNNIGSEYAADGIAGNTFDRIVMKPGVNGVPSTLKTSMGDGGPTSWQAAIIQKTNGLGNNVSQSYREFYFEFADFQLAYQAGVYVGTGPDGITPLDRKVGGITVGTDPRKYYVNIDTGTTTGYTTISETESYKYAINPPVKEGIKTAAAVDNALKAARTELLGGNEPDLVFFPPFCDGANTPRPCPEAIAVDDPGTYVTNYRNEPLSQRVFDPTTQGQAAGIAGDLAFALQSRTDRADAFLNVVQDQPFGNPFTSDGKPIPGLNGGILRQPAIPKLTGNSPSFPNSPVRSAALNGGDPYTHMMRSVSGDKIRVKVQTGATEEGHNASIHGLKWLQEGSGFGHSPNSGWRNSQFLGISEQFTLSTPVTADLFQKFDVADYAYSMDSSSDGWWNGTWGLIRNYKKPPADLFPMPNNPKPLAISNLSTAFFPDGRQGVCPIIAPIRSFDISVVAAKDALPGGTLVYNARAQLIKGIDDLHAISGGFGPSVADHSGPLQDPTALLYVYTSDLDGNGKLLVDLSGKPRVPVEPAVIRAAAGECIKVTLRNKLRPDPDTGKIFDLPGFSSQPAITMLGFDSLRGIDTGVVEPATFNNNRLAPSKHVGIHPQLVEYDVTKSDGTNVGQNPIQTIGPGQAKTYFWYAGNLNLQPIGTQIALLIPTAVEFGHTGLIPADKLKHVEKGMTGSLVVEPILSKWTDVETGGNGKPTRASATVSPLNPFLSNFTPFRDFSIIYNSAINLRYAGDQFNTNGVAVPNVKTEGGGVSEDAEDAAHTAVNLRIEPPWFRFGFPPDLDFNNQRQIPNTHEAYSNTCCSTVFVDLASPGDISPIPFTIGSNLNGVPTLIGEPETPIFKVKAGTPTRVGINEPGGKGRNKTFTLHGHVWQRQPYLSLLRDSNGFPIPDVFNPLQVGSWQIGDNPLAFYKGNQDGFGPTSHFDLVLGPAGGDYGITGDYLFRDLAHFTTSKGPWGILRVTP